MSRLIFVSKNDVDFFFCCFPSSIIITVDTILHVFVRYLLYLLLLQCLYPGVNKEMELIRKSLLRSLYSFAKRKVNLLYEIDFLTFKCNHANICLI